MTVDWIDEYINKFRASSMPVLPKLFYSHHEPVHTIESIGLYCWPISQVLHRTNWEKIFFKKSSINYPTVLKNEDKFSQKRGNDITFETRIYA